MGGSKGWAEHMVRLNSEPPWGKRDFISQSDEFSEEEITIALGVINGC